jgi:formylglycine-generating enzyme required for sulfatase activity/predicted Ser/Thr protein kinase
VAKNTKKCPYCREDIIADAIKCKHCGSTLSTPPTPSYDTLDMPLVGIPTAAGRVFSGRYRIVKELGRGGMGVVYLAHDEELDMDVALKFLPVELANSHRALEQLQSEAKLSMTLSHPNIMRLHNLDTAGQFKFLVMEYVDGPDLLDLLREKERLPLEEALPIIRQVCDGLDYAHSNRVLHRDLKPANVMLSSKGQAKITDFGIARRMRESMSMVSQKTISGTPAYMAPEHIMGEHLTVRSDIYSLGAVVYELLAGHPPFYQGDILAQIRFKEPPPIAGVPERVNAAVMKALAKEANDRPVSATEFYESLTTTTAGTPNRLAAPPAVRMKKPRVPHPPKPAPSPPPTKKSRAGLVAAILICLAAAGALGYYAWKRSGESTGSAPERVVVSPPTEDAGKKVEAERLAREEQERKKREADARRLREAEAAAEKAHKNAEAEKRAREEAERKLREAVAAEEARKQAQAEKRAREAEDRKKREAKARRPGKSFTNSVGMKFVLISSGEFMMGSPASEKNRGSDETQHGVKITKPFYMQTTEVTQAQWKAVMGNNPSHFKGDNLPVEQISWDDVQEFLKKLSVKEGVTYCLPTEAQWEYACRAGTTGRFCFVDDDSKLGEYAWYVLNSVKKPHPVGMKKPNAWGLYDMHGNVWEWCQDWYDKDYYGKSLTGDPQGPSSGTRRVLRGGGWGSNVGNCQSAGRYWGGPADRGGDFGFRVSRSSQ